MKEAIQGFEKSIETGIISVKGGKLSRHTAFLVDKVPREISDEMVEEGSTLNGLPASAGVVEGSAIVITCQEDLPKMRTGTIVVCPYMSPALTIILSTIKGIVTDYGGMLAPAATIAREYGIPAVVGASVATELIHDGDIIRVDGTEGRVEIIARAH